MSLIEEQLINNHQSFQNDQFQSNPSQLNKQLALLQQNYWTQIQKNKQKTQYLQMLNQVYKSDKNIQLEVIGGFSSKVIDKTCTKKQLVHFIDHILEKNSELDKIISQIKMKQEIDQQCQQMEIQFNCNKHYESLRKIWTTQSIKNTHNNSINPPKKIFQLEEYVQQLNKKVVQTKIRVQDFCKNEKNMNKPFEIISSSKKSPFNFIESKKSNLGQTDNSAQYIKRIVKLTQPYQQLLQKYQQSRMQLEDISSQLQEGKLGAQDKLNCQKQTVKQQSEKVKEQEDNKVIFQLKQKILAHEKKQLELQLRVIDLEDQLFDKNNTIDSLTEKLLKLAQKQGKLPSDQQPKLRPQLTLSDGLEDTQTLLKDTIYNITLSPRLAKLKSMEKIEQQRRQRIRDTKKDFLKTTFKQYQNVAAGVSPKASQILKGAQSPIKFIRKPMSPEWKRDEQVQKQNRIKDLLEGIRDQKVPYFRKKDQNK